MSVRKRVWTTRKGERKEAWIVDYAVTLRPSSARRTPMRARPKSRSTSERVPTLRRTRRRLSARPADGG